jgi:hypothetical protein
VMGAVLKVQYPNIFKLDCRTEHCLKGCERKPLRVVVSQGERRQTVRCQKALYGICHSPDIDKNSS